MGRLRVAGACSYPWMDSTVYWSRGFTRILPTVAFIGVVWVSAFWSFRETDNLILLLSHASLALGAWVSTLIRGQDEDGNTISRLVSAILAIGSLYVYSLADLSLLAFFIARRTSILFS